MSFEALSGIKINYDKTEMYPIHVDETLNLNHIFRCQWGSFPIKYLGLLLHFKQLQVADWQFLVDKIEGRLKNWQGHLLSIGGRITLLNFVLSSIPLYTLSIYKIPLTVLKQIDKIRRRFLWQGTSTKKKYSLLDWKAVCIAKQFGDLGILDLRQINLALLLK